MEWWLLRDDHRAAVFFGGVWVEARVLLRNYEYERVHRGTGSRKTVGLFYFLFLVGAFHGYIK